MEIKNELRRLAEYVTSYTKTKELITMLARSGYDWTEADVDRAVRETGSLPVSLADIDYMRVLLADDSESRLNAMYTHMASLTDVEARKDFFLSTLKPAQDEANTRRENLKAQFTGLVFFGTEATA